MNKKIKVTLFAVFFFTTGLIAAFSCNNMVYGDIVGPDVEIPETAASFPAVQDFSLPRTLSLCGEMIPLENPHVWEMLDREFNITVWDRAQVFMYLKRAGRYFPYIEKKLSEAGMPMDLKHLAVAESALLTYSESSKGAKGIWQFMKPAAVAPSTRRWSDDKVIFIIDLIQISSSRTTGFLIILDTASIAASPGLIMAVKFSTSSIPMLDIVNVPPSISSGISIPLRALLTTSAAES